MKKPILEGINVLECAFAAAAPITTTQLAMHGATVIKVETHKRLDMLRVVPPFRGGKADINSFLNEWCHNHKDDEKNKKNITERNDIRF